MQIIVENLEDLTKVCHALEKLTANHKLFLFIGEMGAGKTTFIKKFISHIGGEETDSPTFSLVNECWLKNGEKAYHFDFYRINSPEEALDIGIEEYLYSNDFCFIEWPQKIENLLPNNFVKVTIDLLDDTRIFNIAEMQ